MPPDDIRALASEIAKSLGLQLPWWNYALMAAISGLAGYFGTYLRKKGENLATKEDIGGITDKIESVRVAYSKQIENLRATHQLRAACLDRRLHAHQGAYSLWRKLLQHVHTDELGATLQECTVWWNNNCLFLSAEARKALHDAIHAASLHRTLLRNHRTEDIPRIEKNWALLDKAGDAIVAGAELPPLRDEAPPGVGHDGLGKPEE